jgi:hypothetical protein
VEGGSEIGGCRMKVGEVEMVKDELMKVIEEDRDLALIDKILSKLKVFKHMP